MIKKFIIFLLIILLFTIALVGFDKFLENVALAITIALILKLVDHFVED
ncbi:MAG: hypothetical protein H0Z18_10905 [Thermococcus sp.]|nr:hypothetical protein [Thermococcus sp.]MBO8175755.1 hypothetical protein [Thermococcus sp.]